MTISMTFTPPFRFRGPLSSSRAGPTKQGNSTATSTRTSNKRGAAMQRKRKASGTLFASATEDLRVKITFAPVQAVAKRRDAVVPNRSEWTEERRKTFTGAARSGSRAGSGQSPGGHGYGPGSSAWAETETKTKSSPSGSPMSNAGASMERPPDCPHLSALSSHILLRAPSLLGGANDIESLRCKHCVDLAMAAKRRRESAESMSGTFLLFSLLLPLLRPPAPSPSSPPTAVSPIFSVMPATPYCLCSPLFPVV